MYLYILTCTDKSVRFCILVYGLSKRGCPDEKVWQKPICITKCLLSTRVLQFIVNKQLIHVRDKRFFNTKPSYLSDR